MNRPLDPRAIYVTPLGLRCKLATEGARWVNQAAFEYLDAPGEIREGFTLTEENYHLLRREPTRAASR